ncbi:hypothetical protein [Nonomuraea sp. NPDC050643]|uniref:hypothetical protein n=1 Tax=Nonomuraea sp. NPDC050643 TaxID=3155660 RepID=UPI00340148B3
MASLTAGVSWLVAGPAAAAVSCTDSEPALLSPTSIAAYCDEHARLRVNDGGPSSSSRMVATESNRLAMAAGDMARRLGLTGLASGKSALGVADLGGMAATWGMPSLASASPSLFPMVPGPIGMKDLSTMAGMPAMPSLPELPNTPLTAKLPAEMTLGQAPYNNRIAGSGVQSPMDVEKPVREVGEDVVGVLLPKAVESVEGTSMLPGGEAVTGFTGLVQGLGLR